MVVPCMIRNPFAALFNRNNEKDAAMVPHLAI